MKIQLILVFLFFSFLNISFAQTISDSTYTTKSYLSSIKTILVYKTGFEQGQAIIELGAGEQLTLAFDELDSDLKQYKFSIIHCDANWKLSDIQTSDYLQGMQEDFITNSKPSFNTIQKYIHYEVNFPNENMKIIESGNYIINVFDEEKPETIILTARFMVTEKLVGIDASMQQSNIIQDMFYKQKINFSIDLGGYRVSNPYRELKVIVQQNGRWDNALAKLQPRIIIDNKLMYDYENGENTINGGSEFRYFDIKSIRYQSERIKKIETDSLGNTHVYLLPDISRQFKTYSTSIDINGRYAVHSDLSVQESAIEADYAYVHFTLPFKAPEAFGDVYIFGGLTEWNYKPEAKMKYNFNSFAYECTLYLKQGYYNYEYVVLDKSTMTGDETRVEGTHHETGNDYFIYVYHRPPGYLYDKLIGVKVIN